MSKVISIENGAKKLVTKKDVGDYFSNAFYIPVSESFPAICISRLHESDTKTEILNLTTFPLLVLLLRAEKWKFQNSENIGYTSFTPGVTTVIQLTPANSTTVNQPFLELVNEMLYYHNSKDRGAALVAQDFTDLNLVATFNGVDSRIIGLNLISEEITLDYDSSLLSTSAGNIQIYPNRIATSEVDSASKAQIRKLREETTLASGFNSSGLLENRSQEHKHDLPHEVAFSSNLYASSGSPPAWRYFGEGGSQDNKTSKGVESDSNGTIRDGKTTRSNQIQTKIYIYAGVYNA